MLLSWELGLICGSQGAVRFIARTLVNVAGNEVATSVLSFQRVWPLDSWALGWTSMNERSVGWKSYTVGVMSQGGDGDALSSE